MEYNVLRLGEVPTLGVNQRTKYYFGIAPKRCYRQLWLFNENLIKNTKYKNYGM